MRSGLPVTTITFRFHMSWRAKARMFVLSVLPGPDVMSTCSYSAKSLGGRLCNADFFLFLSQIRGSYDSCMCQRKL
jgi:hypothetical protein